MADSYTSEREEIVEPFPGAIAALTNSQSATQRQKLNLTPFFEAMVIEGEFGVGKPDERVYRHVLGQFGVAAESSWMVGDNLEWDVASPQRVGMKGIWVDYAGVGLPTSSATKPDQIIRHLSGLILA